MLQLDPPRRKGLDCSALVTSQCRCAHRNGTTLRRRRDSTARAPCSAALCACAAVAAMKLLIKQSAGALHTLPDVDATLSVAALKALLSEPPFSVPVEQQRLVYKGHVMKDNSTLADYGARRAPALRACFVLGTFFLTMPATRAHAPPRQAWRASTPFTSCGKTGACSRALALCRRAVVVTRGSPWVPSVVRTALRRHRPPARLPPLAQRTLAGAPSALAFLAAGKTTVRRRACSAKCCQVPLARA